MVDADELRELNNIVIDRNVEFDRDVSRQLQDLFKYAILVIDDETSGNSWVWNGLLSQASMDFFNPAKNFYGECHLRDHGTISLRDIKKNEFGDPERFQEIINPEGDYSTTLDPDAKRMIQFNSGFFPDQSLYRQLQRKIVAVRDSKIPGKDFIEGSQEQLMVERYRWLKTGMTNVSYTGDFPVVTPMGQNDKFDIGFEKLATAYAGIGAFQRFLFYNMDELVDEKAISFPTSEREVRELLEEHPEKWEKAVHEWVEFTEYSMAYRGHHDMSARVESFIIDVCDHEKVKDYWEKTEGKRELVPILQGQGGLTLDRLCSFTGLPPRPQVGSGAHDAFEDVLLTAEIAARIYTGKPYIMGCEGMDLDWAGSKVLCNDFRKDG